MPWLCEDVMKLSEKLERYRTDRPDEWTMDGFARHARQLEEALQHMVENIGQPVALETRDGFEKAKALLRSPGAGCYE